MRMFATTATLLGVIFLTQGPNSGAESEPLVQVPTQQLDIADHRPNRADPADRVAAPKPATLVLQRAPLPGTGRVPQGRSRHYAAVGEGARAQRLVFVERGGGKLVLAWDPDGDGNLGGPGAEQVLDGRKGKAQGRPALKYLFRGVRLGAAPADVAFQLVAPEHQAVLVDPAVSEDPQPIALTVAPPAGVQALAAGLGAARYGRVDGYAVAFVRGERDRLNVIVDRNENGVLGDSGELVPAPVAGRDGDATYWQVEGVRIGARTVTLALQEIAGFAKATMRPTSARRGRAELGGASLHLHLLDADLDGAYDGAADRWWLGPVEHLRQVRRLGPDAMVEGNEPVFLGGDAWRLETVDPQGVATLRRDPGAGTLYEYMHRRADRVNRERWWPVFDAEAAHFRQEHGIDPNRPKVAKPAHWVHDVDLRAVLAAAKKQNKPILVDFEADWCSWCKRFDYYVYIDAEVAELLSRFLLVKINKEFHFTGDFDRLGGEGLPYLVFLDPQGKPLQLTLVDEHGQPKVCAGPPGFQPPAEFAKTLRAALKACGR